MIYYQQGQIVDLSFQKKVTRNMLLNYLGEFVSNSNVRTFKVKEPLEDGKTLVRYEVWNCQDLETGKYEVKRFPVYFYEDEPEEYSIKDRTDTINDINEVTSLLDSYDCWKEYCSLSVPAEAKRDKLNFHLDIVNDKHSRQIFKLKELDSDNSLDKNMRIGVRLKLIQKENPNHYTYRDLQIWKKEFPALFTKIIDYAYSNTSDS